MRNITKMNKYHLEKIIIFFIVFSPGFIIGQNEWNTTNNSTSNMYRNGFVGIGTGVAPTIPFAVKNPTVSTGTKVVFGNNVLSGGYGVGDGAVEIFSPANTTSTTSYLNFLAGASTNRGKFSIGLTSTSVEFASGKNSPGIARPFVFTTAPINAPIERLRINASDGYVGIATSTPIQLLDVNGRVNVQNGVIQKGGGAITTTGDLGLYSRDPGTWMRLVTTGQPINFYTDGGTNPIGVNTVMSLLPSKNVVIGFNGNSLDDTKLFVETVSNTNGKVGVVSKSTFATPYGYGFISAFPTNQFKAFAAINYNTSEEVFLVMGDGLVYAKEIRVRLTPFPDYVFFKDYHLMPLKELEAFITKYNHLPNIPAAKDVEKEGIGIGELQVKQLEKIEELTLYIIQLKNEMDNLKSQMNDIRNK